MSETEFVRVQCCILRSGFSGERIARVTQVNGEEYYGAIPTSYCYDRNGQPIPPDRPAPGEEMEGLVDGVLLRNGGDQAVVSMPDGDTIKVEASKVLKLVQKVEREYVPVGSGSAVGH